MKLKEGVVLHFNGEKYIALTTGNAAKNFNGITYRNSTGNFIMNLLLNEDISELEIIQAVTKKYDVDSVTAGKDVHRFLENLRHIGILDE